LREPPAYDATTAVYPYRFPIDRMVQALKYQQRFALALHFSRALVDVCPEREFDLIVPMPLHPERLRERGFNQAVEVSRLLARRRGIPLALAGVERVLATPAQVSLPWKARSANMRGAFCCDMRLDGCRVLVVDDVMTTGASLQALAQALREAGAARIENLLIARTPRSE
jgi:ComF family protein